MSDFKLCENGHYYPKNLDECPYCPKASKGKGQVTQLGGGDDDQKSNFQLDKTMQQDKKEDISQTQIFGQSNTDLSRTQIFGGSGGGMYGGGGMMNNPQFEPKPQSLGRKMVGWLVSFTIDPLGIDFKIYEGRNLIGSDHGCDIVVQHDSAVSGKHLTILYRLGHFKFKDELSTNGTFINDVFEEEGNLKDGDMIKIGETIFKFRSIA